MEESHPQQKEEEKETQLKQALEDDKRACFARALEPREREERL